MLVYYKLVNAWEVRRIIYVGSSKIARHGLKSKSMDGASLHKLDVQFYLEVSFRLEVKLNFFSFTLINNHFSIFQLNLICLTSVSLPTIRTGILPIWMTDYRYLVIFLHGSTCLVGY
jgi:hypothetical protein